jgi:hypothetical protein
MSLALDDGLSSMAPAYGSTPCGSMIAYCGVFRAP